MLPRPGRLRRRPGAVSDPDRSWPTGGGASLAWSVPAVRRRARSRPDVWLRAAPGRRPAPERAGLGVTGARGSPREQDREVAVRQVVAPLGIALMAGASVAAAPTPNRGAVFVPATGPPSVEQGAR